MDALLLIDLQNDFVPGGALAVAEGDRVVPVANRLIERFELSVVTQDWHPPNHASFAANHPGRKPGDVIAWHGLSQVLWPVHCVQGTHGAEFHPALNRSGIYATIQKGTDPAIDSYSAFFDNARRKATGLEKLLRERGVERVFVMGLATDYCVKFTVLDALSLGFQATLVLDGCRGVNLKPGDVEVAVEDMRKAGAEVIAAESIGHFR